MKIAFISSLYKPNIVGGAEKIVGLLAEGLIQKGVECVVVCLSPSEERTEIINGVTVYYLGLKNLYWPFQPDKTPLRILKSLWHLADIYNPLMVNKVGNILRTENPDIVCTHNLAGFSDGIWVEAKKQGKKILHVLHDYYQLCSKSTLFNHDQNCNKRCFACWLYSSPKQRMSQVVDGVIGVSEFVLQRHLQFGFFKKALVKKVIHNGIPTPPPTPSFPNERKTLRCGFIGQIDKIKGIEVLLDAFLRSKVEFDGRISLDLAGKGKKEYVDYLKTAYPLDNIRYLGFVKPEDFYPRIDLLVVPSIWNEPFGTVLLEALSYGVPVLATRRGGNPEIIEDNKQGFLFDPNEPGSLKTIFLNFLNSSSLLNVMSVNACSKAKCFSYDAMVNSYNDVLLSLS
jgi:glycosyltransferase involved in cell wall biosynthesis